MGNRGEVKNISRPVPKICHIYPAMRKPGSYILPKEGPKNIWITRHLSSAEISIFSLEISKFCYMKEYRYRLHFYIFNSFNFPEVFKDFLINMFIILIISARMATLDLLKPTVFWSKSHDVIVFVHNFIKKNLSHNSNYIVDVVMWPKFGNPSISMREVIKTSIL